jgi:two-component system OmpR family response regulator
MRILLVEDDDVLRDIVWRSLRDKGHTVDVAASIAAARQAWRSKHLDAVLLDLRLPRTGAQRSGLGSGLKLLQEMRGAGDRTPVLVLTAHDRTEERIAGLNAGADDYLGKPFDLDEVEARLRSLLRRIRAADERTILGTLSLDRQARRFSFSGQPWDLPAREFEVLWELMTPPGRVVSKRDLAQKLSQPDEPLADNALEVFISKLRKRLAASSVSIRTLRGLGYVIEETPRL